MIRRFFLLSMALLSGIGLRVFTYPLSGVDDKITDISYIFPIFVRPWKEIGCKLMLLIEMLKKIFIKADHQTFLG